MMRRQNAFVDVAAFDGEPHVYEIGSTEYRTTRVRKVCTGMGCGIRLSADARKGLSAVRESVQQGVVTCEPCIERLAALPAPDNGALAA